MTLTLEEAQAQLPDLVRRNLTPGEEVAITDGGRIVARLVRHALAVPPQPGGIGAILGQWPGDETDEEVAAALDELS